MLSTTVEPECRQRPFVTSYVMTEPRSEADRALAREATKVLAYATIQPAADRVKAYGAAARAISPAVL